MEADAEAEALLSSEEEAKAKAFQKSTAATSLFLANIGVSLKTSLALVKENIFYQAKDLQSQCLNHKSRH